MPPACNQPRPCRHPWLSLPFQQWPQIFTHVDAPVHVALPRGIDSRVQTTATSLQPLQNLPDALYMEYALTKVNPGAAVIYLERWRRWLLSLAP
jgi:hypothetical protein